MDDKEILKQFQSKETKNAAFNLLIDKYQQKVYWHIRKMVIDHDDADDLTQEVFIKIWTSLESFRGDSQLYTWVYKIATNYCLNFLNSKRKKIFSPLEGKHDLIHKLNNSDHISGDEIQLKLQKAILGLPDKQRLVFNMKYYDDMKYEDISEVVGTSVGALKASYHLAVKKIEDYLNNMP